MDLRRSEQSASLRSAETPNSILGDHTRLSSTLVSSENHEEEAKPGIGSTQASQGQHHLFSAARDLPTAPTEATYALSADRSAMGKDVIFRVDQSASAWQTAKEALEAGMNGLADSHTPQRTGGRRGRGPRRHVSPLPSGSITLRPSGDDTAAIVIPASSRGQSSVRRGPRGNAPRGGRAKKPSTSMKRKRQSDSDGELNGNDSSTSEEITNLPSQSRSGRKITQAVHSSMKIDPDEEAVNTKPSILGQSSNNMFDSTPIPANKMAPKQPRKIAKRIPGASAVCRNCGRGHSPATNAIVFCDGCNSAWHQFCHDPTIQQEYLLNLDKDWYCGDCVMLREHSNIMEGKVAGTNMAMTEKRKYLKTLPPSALVALLLHASSLYPALPIFPPKPPVVNIDIATLAEGHAELYEEVVDELPYPKAGNGIQLRPESEDITMLIDDNTVVYSHRWTGIGEMMTAAGWPGKHSAGVRTANADLSVRTGLL